jgi:hypothetical protein
LIKRNGNCELLRYLKDPSIPLSTNGGINRQQVTPDAD